MISSSPHTRGLGVRLVTNNTAEFERAILLFTKTNSGGTDHVWFYDVDADGWSLDDKRTLLLSEDKLGVVPRTSLTAEEHEKNNLPDVLARWSARDGAETWAPADGAELLRAEERHRGAGI